MVENILSPKQASPACIKEGSYKFQMFHIDGKWCSLSALKGPLARQCLKDCQRGCEEPRSFNQPGCELSLREKSWCPAPL